MSVEERENDPPGTIIAWEGSINEIYTKFNDGRWYSSEYEDDGHDNGFGPATMGIAGYKVLYRPIAVGDIINSEQARALPAGSITRLNVSWADQHQLILDDGDYWFAGPNGSNGRGAQPLGSNGNDYVVIYINHSN